MTISRCRTSPSGLEPLAWGCAVARGGPWPSPASPGHPLSDADDSDLEAARSFHALDSIEGGERGAACCVQSAAA